MLKESLPVLPESPGIYQFFDGKKVIYIGKAINLKRRVMSYFDLHLEPKTKKMVKSATNLKFIKVTSEIESLLLEASLIKKYMPHYNIVAKDDKHPLYIVISDDDFPRVVTARKLTAIESKHFYGPFPSSKNVKQVLRMVRRIFPYSDHKLGKRACIYSHIGLCNPCPNEIVQSSDYLELRKKYLQNIKSISMILNRRFNMLRISLVKEMSIHSKNQEFEKAGEVKQKIEALDYITEPRTHINDFIKNPNLYNDISDREHLALLKLVNEEYPNLDSLKRIECFDIAHLAGVSATASMVVIEDGEIAKDQYRHFRILQKKGASDYDSMTEVATRRKKHLGDWGKPDLIIVDGGIGQLKKFKSILPDIAIVGVAKNPDRLILNADKKIKLSSDAWHLVSRIRNEAHRFARRYHHKLLLKRESLN